MDQSFVVVDLLCSFVFVYPLNENPMRAGTLLSCHSGNLTASNICCAQYVDEAHRKSTILLMSIVEGTNEHNWNIQVEGLVHKCLQQHYSQELNSANNPNVPPLMNV